MIPADKILSAVRHNWRLSLLGLALSFAASVALVRTLSPEVFAQYSAVLAIIGVATLVFEAGANSGLTRYLREAGEQNARGTFFRKMQARRALAAVGCAAALAAFGPAYARLTDLGLDAAPAWLFLLIAAIVAGSLAKLLAHYGLLALFESRMALLLQQAFLILRSGALAAVGFAGGGLTVLVGTLLAVTCLEAGVVNARLWRIIAAERAPLPAAFVDRAQKFGLLTVFDKACALLGSGTVLLLVLAPQQPALVIAVLALAVDLVGKIVSLTVMPMGNLVAPYLGQAGDDAAAQSKAAARVVKLSSVLYGFGVGAGVLLLPFIVPVVFGEGYRAAAGLALLLLAPTAFENWVRGCASPVLLRSGRHCELMRINGVQAVATLATLALFHGAPVATVLIALGAVRSGVSAFNLVLLRPLLPAGTYRVPLLAALVGLASWGVAAASAALLSLPAVALALVFSAVFYAGVRWLVFRDADTLYVVRRLAGGGVLGRLLPASNP